MNDALDVQLSDDELLAEMTLLVALIVTANATPRVLSAREIDDALGLGQDPGTPTTSKTHRPWDSARSSCGLLNAGPRAQP